MVEYIPQLDLVFSSLSDPTRRDILRRVAGQDLSIGQIAENYGFSFAAIAKHVDVLCKARLVSKTRRGKEQIVAISPQALAQANRHLEEYQTLWENRLDALGEYLESANGK